MQNEFDWRGTANKDYQQWLLPLVVKSRTINLLPQQGTITPYKQCNIKENHHLENKLVQKLYDEN